MADPENYFMFFEGEEAAGAGSEHPFSAAALSLIIASTVCVSSKKIFIGAGRDVAPPGEGWYNNKNQRMFTRSAGRSGRPTGLEGNL